MRVFLAGPYFPIPQSITLPISLRPTLLTSFVHSLTIATLLRYDDSLIVLSEFILLSYGLLMPSYRRRQLIHWEYIDLTRWSMLRVATAEHLVALVIEGPMLREGDCSL